MELQLQTTHFGTIKYVTDEVIHFPEGIFGFEEEKEFLPIPFNEDDDSLLCLQSTKTEELSFILMNPFYLLSSYNPSLTKTDIVSIGSPSSENISYYIISVLKDTMAESTVNLKCPIAVNTVTRTARQVVLEQPEYTFRHTLKSLEAKEV